jgi:hypothetical protein
MTNAASPPTGTGTLSVQKAGPGTGTVTSTPAGIGCGPTCEHAWPAGTVVTLEAVPDAGWVFAGWSGDPDCADGRVTATDAKTCRATFTAHLPAFTTTAPSDGATWLSSANISVIGAAAP